MEFLSIIPIPNSGEVQSESFPLMNNGQKSKFIDGVRVFLSNFESIFGFYLDITQLLRSGKNQTSDSLTGYLQNNTFCVNDCCQV